jgi:hypothetical protein
MWGYDDPAYPLFWDGHSFITQVHLPQGRKLPRRATALRFPRDVWLTRLQIQVQAWWLRRKGLTFRNYVHSLEAIIHRALNCANGSLTLHWKRSEGFFCLSLLRHIPFHLGGPLLDAFHQYPITSAALPCSPRVK